MQDFKPSSYLCLKNFSHQKLFLETEPVWNALHLLASYLESQPLGKIEVDVPPSAYLINPETISIGARTIIEPGAFIQGPCIIGSDCRIRHGAYIRGYVVIGDECIVGHSSEVKHSILIHRSHAPHFNYVGDSILGCDVNLGAGVKLANYRLDHKNVTLVYQGQKIDTNLRKFGAIIGDSTKMGCNAVTNPGTLIGPASSCYPCISIGGIIPPQTTIKE